MTKIQTQFCAFLLLCLAGPAASRAQQLTDLGIFNGSDGKFPAGGLILSPDGTTLYGTTNNGGANGMGEVYSIPVSGGTPTVLGSFAGSNGSNPEGGLVLSGGLLYGTTASGGANGLGTVFSLPIAGGTPTTLTSFNGTNGQAPKAGLVLNGSTLYGTTFLGGANGVGEVFSLSITGGTPTVLTNFNASTGEGPVGRLLLNGGTLYGAAESGGASGDGAVYSLSLGGGTPTVLASFNNTNGTMPVSGLVLSPSGSTLYGITLAGGANGNGVVYSLPIGGGTPTILTNFSGGAGGLLPSAGLALSADGKTLYGGTNEGGVSGEGVIYSLSTSGGRPTVLANFNVTNGDEPVGEFVLSGSTVYGVTNGGGPSGFGVIFSVPEPCGTGLLLAGSLATLARRRRERPSA